MRPQQQNRRMRGRGSNNNNNNNNNRRGPNPLTRSFESNGPDVKIRGTAQQIADKYTTLARDAQSSGDRVIAENYLQHAEHYNRIIATALAQQQQQQQQQQNVRDDGEDDTEDRDEFDATADRNERPERNERNERPDRNERYDRQDRDRNGSPANDGSGPQPVIEGLPAEIALKDSESRRKPATKSRLNGDGEAAANGAEAHGEQPEGEAAEVEAGSAEDGAPKRPRRPRRAAPRSRAKADEGAEGETPPQGEQEPVQS